MRCRGAKKALAFLFFLKSASLLAQAPVVKFDATQKHAFNLPAVPASVSNKATTTKSPGHATLNFNANASIPYPPDISYQSPQTYNLNTAITQLQPTNTGGNIPANSYGLVLTIAGSGKKGNLNAQGIAASFLTPVGVICDQSENLYVSEYGNNDIRKIDASLNVTTYAGTGTAGYANGPANKASFSYPYQMAFDAAGNLYVGDVGNNQVREISKLGVVSVYAGSGGQGSTNGPAATAEFYDPIGIAFDPTGNMFVADRGNGAIRKIDPLGNVTLFSMLGGGLPAYDGLGLDFLTTDAAGNLFFTYTNQVEESTPVASVKPIAGNANSHGFADGPGATALFNALVGIALTPGGAAYVADDGNSRIRRVAPDGTVSTVAGGNFSGFSDGLASAAFNAPNGVAIDPSGDFLYVADAGNNAIRKVAITGYSIDKSLPTGLVFDPTTGTISGTPAITSPPETYTITAYNNGGSSSSTVVIQIVDDETITFPALPAKTACDADFDPGATSATAITYTSSDVTVATIVSGLVHIVGAGATTITASDGVSQAKQTLTVTAAITPTIQITPAAPDTCQGSQEAFTAVITGGGTQPSYQWQVNGQNAGTNSPQFSPALNNGDRVTCVLTSNAICTASNPVTSNTAMFTLDPFITTSVAITSSPNGPICAGTSVTFTAVPYSPNTNPVYQWQVNGVNTGTGKPTFTSDGLNNGDSVTCVLTSTGKCIVDQQTTSNAITITLNPRSLCVVTVPNTFTPNNDGVNDLWDITALQSYPGCTVSIYNRNGELVYNTINYPKPWDGTYNGRELPVGTYYYVIDLKNGKRPLAGSVTILR